jgi:hypothetical protein
VHEKRQLCSIKALYFCLSLSWGTQTVDQLESTAEERLAAKNANGALAAYEKLACRRTTLPSNLLPYDHF